VLSPELFAEGQEISVCGRIGNPIGRGASRPAGRQALCVTYTLEVDMAFAVTASRAKVAELMSGVGALVAGIGIGSYLPLFGRSAAGVVIVLGAILHTAGMWEVRRLEEGTLLPRWTTGVYVVCWVLLAAGAVLLAPALW
jgi:hypothetical protein